jgi:hypothetical protein
MATILSFRFKHRFEFCPDDDEVTLNAERGFSTDGKPIAIIPFTMLQKRVSCCDPPITEDACSTTSMNERLGITP